MTNQATPSFSALPEELVVEILSRLPPKLFFRCKSICKSWLSLCSEALPRNKHLKPTLSGLFYNDINFETGDTAVRFINLSSGADGNVSVVPYLHQFEILDYCNGLLLLQEWCNKGLAWKGMCIYNPATKTRFNVDLPAHEFHSNHVFLLAFDPCIPSLFHLVKFCYHSDVMPFIEIFSFEQGKLKRKQKKELASHMKVESSSKSTFVNGKVHRLTSQNEILSIDPNNGSYQLIHRPYLQGKALIDEIGQSQGLLHCIYGCDILSIWVYSYTQCEWTLKHQLCPYEIMKSACNPHIDELYILSRMHHLRHFAFHQEKDVLFVPLENGFFSLELNTGKIEKLCNVRADAMWNWWVYMPCYVV